MHPTRLKNIGLIRFIQLMVWIRFNPILVRLNIITWSPHDLLPISVNCFFFNSNHFIHFLTHSPCLSSSSILRFPPTQSTRFLVAPPDSSPPLVAQSPRWRRSPGGGVSRFRSARMKIPHPSAAAKPSRRWRGVSASLSWMSSWSEPGIETRRAYRRLSTTW